MVFELTLESIGPHSKLLFHINHLSLGRHSGRSRLFFLGQVKVCDLSIQIRHAHLPLLLFCANTMVAG